MPRDLTQAGVSDDFVTGNATGSAVGALDWQGSGTSVQAGVAGHPGIMRLTTPASSGATAYVALCQLAPILGSETFDMVVVFKLTTADGTNGQRIGVATTPVGVPTDGVYLEKLDTDTSWFGVARAGGSQTRTAALGTADTGWHKVRVRRVSGTTVGFTLDAGAEATVATTVPGAVALNPVVTVFNAPASALARVLDVDYADLYATGLVR